MSKSRMTLIAAVAAFAVMLVGGVGTAAAQTPAKASQVVAITGAAKNGKKFSGTYTIQRFTQSGGKLYAVGTLTGKLKNRKVSRSNVAIPAALTGNTGASAAQAACDILHLTLGPLDLNLLGLRVQLNEVHLDITAVPGAGNLLGNLLCALTGILDQGGLLGQLGNLANGLNQVASALNAILALLPSGPATAATAVAGR